ncbi:MAG: hypothetical protein ACI4U5_06230 [Bacilli bacterium]
MKNIDDKDIKEMFSNCEKYEIKKTSSSILNKYNSLEETKTEKNKKCKLIVIPLTSLALCLSIALVIVLNVFDFSNKEETGDISANKYLSQQIFTFMSFFKGNQNNSLSVMPQKNIDQTAFSSVVDKYEKIQGGVRDLFSIEDNILEVKESNFTYLGVTYKYQIDYSSSNNTCISSLYYNELLVDDNDNELLLEGIFSYLDSYYYVNIESESKEKKNRVEEEVTTILRNVDETKDSKVYIMEKENEYKGNKTENSYSFKTYNSYQDMLNKKLASVIEYEKEYEFINVSYQSKEEEFEFEDITQINESNYVFRYDDDDLDINNLLIKLTYNVDLSRTYVANDLTITKN